MLLLVLVLIVALGVGCIVSAVRLWRRPQGGHVAVRGVASVIRALLGLWLTLMGVGLFLNRSWAVVDRPNCPGRSPGSWAKEIVRGNAGSWYCLARRK